MNLIRDVELNGFTNSEVYVSYYDKYSRKRHEFRMDILIQYPFVAEETSTIIDRIFATKQPIYPTSQVSEDRYRSLMCSVRLHDGDSKMVDDFVLELGDFK